MREVQCNTWTKCNAKDKNINSGKCNKTGLNTAVWMANYPWYRTLFCWGILKKGTSLNYWWWLMCVRGVTLRQRPSGWVAVGYCGWRLQERGDWRKVIAPQVIVAIDGIDCGCANPLASGILVPPTTHMPISKAKPCGLQPAYPTTWFSNVDANHTTQIWLCKPSCQEHIGSSDHTPANLKSHVLYIQWPVCLLLNHVSWKIKMVISFFNHNPNS